MRLSVSKELLDAAVGEIAAAGYARVIALGDLSDDGRIDTIRGTLQAVTEAGLESWVVPGNHDLRLSPDALNGAVIRCPGSSTLRRESLGTNGAIAVIGHGLQTDDGGKTCYVPELPDLEMVAARVLLWISHYPVVSQQARLHARGLRYAGDLLNMSLPYASVSAFGGPVLVLHGHLHCPVIWRDARILQIGAPAIVEWPHAWAGIAIDLVGATARVSITLHPVGGSWTTPAIDTMLDKFDCAWVYADGRWEEDLVHSAAP